MDGFTALDHTFVVCAYQESPFLEHCIQSLRQQTVQSNIIMTTATPSDFLEEIARQYQLPLIVNPKKPGIGSDWNFGLAQATTPLVTIAHQDDIYTPHYLEKMLQALNRSKNPLIGFTDYCELRGDQVVADNRLLKTKERLLRPLRIRKFCQVRWIRRRVLSLGCSICCPSVTYVKPRLPSPLFETKYKSDLDWQAWEKLSRLKGSFAYCHEPLMYHRIHETSATTEIIGDNQRTQEDFEMLCQFWPQWLAKKINRIYAKSQDSNELDRS